MDRQLGETDRKGREEEKEEKEEVAEKEKKDYYMSECWTFYLPIIIICLHTDGIKGLGLVLWHINHYRLFNAKSGLFKYIRYIWFVIIS